MTISNTSRLAGPFLGNGATTDFPFGFKVFSTSDMLVVLTVVSTGISADQVLNLNYYVVLNNDQNANPGGTIKMLTAPPTGTSLVVTSDMAVTQTLDLTNSGGFYPTVINAALDRVVILIQQIYGTLSRTVRFPLSDGKSISQLPSAGVRAGKLLGFDSAGGFTAVTPTDGSAASVLTTLSTPAGATLLGFQQSGAGTIVRTLQAKASDIVNGLDFGMVLDGATDDAPALQRALNTGKYVTLPNRPMLLRSGVVLVQGGGIIGGGEKSQIIRGFTGGRLIGFPGGDRQLGSPIVLRDFSITTAGGITVAPGDTGIDIGYGTPEWVGRGDISNIVIIGQWDAFKWVGSTMSPINSVYCLQNMGHGFYSIGGRGELTGCLAQFNAGNGYFFYAQVQGETGVQLTSCGTFGNQGWGFLFDAAAGIIGANIFLKGISSSTDGLGGIGFVKEYRQIWLTQCLIESAGSAYLTYPSFVVHNDAPGLYMVGGCKQFVGSDIYIQTCRGGGAFFDSVSRASIGNIIVIDNGQGQLGGVNGVGINFNGSNASFTISGLICDYGAYQTTDIAFSQSANDVILIAPTFRTISNVGTSVNRILDSRTTASSTIASASSLVLPIWGSEITVTGSVNIDSIAISWEMRKVDLLFQSACSIANGNNQVLAGVFTATPSSTISLVYKGGKWIETARSIK